MSLTLDEIRNTRFHIARRSGYVVLEVDAFVDRIEATVEALESERDQLAQQVKALQGSGQNTGSPVAATTSDAPRSGDSDEVARLRRELAARDSKGDAAAELAALREENASLKRQLAERQGAAVKEQAGAAEHLVVTTSAEASPAVVRLVELATQQAEAVTREAEEKAKTTLSDAEEKAATTVREADEKASTTVREAEEKARHDKDAAQAEAERLSSEAKARADEMESQLAAKRSDAMGKLEQERQELDYKIEQLRRFETHYRSTLTAHLEQQIASIRDAELEPADKPELLNEPRIGVAPLASAPEAAVEQDAKPVEPQTQEAPQGTPTSPRLAALLGDDDAPENKPEA